MRLTEKKRDELAKRFESAVKKAITATTPGHVTNIECDYRMERGQIHAVVYYFKQVQVDVSDLLMSPESEEGES